jgi:hypothetical protein
MIPSNVHGEGETTLRKTIISATSMRNVAPYPRAMKETRTFIMRKKLCFFRMKKTKKRYGHVVLDAKNHGNTRGGTAT